MPLNGITIKNVKEFTGHEFPVCTQGDVWDGKTKLGFWSQDSWGGGDEYQGFEDVICQKAEQFQKGFRKEDFKDPIMYDVLKSPDVFMGYVLVMKDVEKLYRRAKGPEGFALFTMTKGEIRARPVNCRVRDKEDLQARGKELYQRLVRDLGTEDFIVWSCGGNSDLNITVDENHPVPEFLRHAY